MNPQAFVFAVVWSALLGCPPAEPAREGDNAGECSDSLDNDQDAYFDCVDPDCIWTTDCVGGDDDTVGEPGDDDDWGYDNWYDDDDDDDDDDWEYLRFSWSMTFSDPGPKPPLDDDDSGADEGGAWEVEAEILFAYVEWDAATGVETVECVQRVLVEGVAGFGPAVGLEEGCGNCTAFIEFDHLTALDVSNPGVNADDCDPAIFDGEAVINYGMGFLTPSGVEPGHIWQEDGAATNYGDWLRLGVVNRAVHDEEGTDFCLGDVDCTPSGLQAAAVERLGESAVYAASVALDAREGAGTAAALLGLEAVTGPIDGASDWLFGGTLSRNSEENPFGDPVSLRGDYEGEAGFVLTRGPGP